MPRRELDPGRCQARGGERGRQTAQMRGDHLQVFSSSGAYDARADRRVSVSLIDDDLVPTPLSRLAPNRAEAPPHPLGDDRSRSEVKLMPGLRQTHGKVDVIDGAERRIKPANGVEGCFSDRQVGAISEGYPAQPMCRAKQHLTLPSGRVWVKGEVVQGAGNEPVLGRRRRQRLEPVDVHNVVGVTADQHFAPGPFSCQVARSSATSRAGRLYEYQRQAVTPVANYVWAAIGGAVVRDH